MSEKLASLGRGAERTGLRVRPQQVGEIAERFGLFVMWGLTVLVFAIVEPSTFATWGNFTTIFGTQSVLVILTLGLMVPMVAGDYDLSVANNLQLSAMVLALLNGVEGWSVLAAVIVALLVGTGVGFVNGLLIVGFGIDSFIVTLGTATFIGGLTLFISNSQTVSGISAGLTDPIIAHRFLGIPLCFYYAIALGVAMWYFLERTPLGRRLLFVGRGREVSRLSGINVARVRFGALVAAGFISAAAGVVYVGTQASADPTSGISFLLPAFAAVFLSATTLKPGFFNAPGAIIAVYFLATGITGFELMGAQGYVQDLFYGGALVVAVVLARLVRRRGREVIGGVGGG